METEVEVSRVFTENKNANTRVIVNEGSSRSTKTYSIAQLLIIKCMTTPNLVVTACRSRMTWVRLSISRDFKTIMKQYFGYWNERSFNKLDMCYNFENGSMFQFMGLDDHDKVHGYKGDILWINEAIQVNFDSYSQLAMRTTQQIILDYNPNAEQHWIYDKVIPRDDCTFIKSTYKDNPWLEKAIVDEIERLEPNETNIRQGTANETLWKVYGLGERAAHEGLIFGKAKIVKSLPPEEDRKKTFYGLDFGFTNDPTALIEVVLAHGELWLHEHIYERGLVNRKDPKNPERPSIEGRLEELGIRKDVPFWADSAEPKSIEDICNAGWHRIDGAKKGADSIVNGIQAMLRYNINITESSMNLIKEKGMYAWAQDKDGNHLNKPTDAYNHGFDASRYGCIMEVAQVWPDSKGVTFPQKPNLAGKTIEDKLRLLSRRGKVERSFD